ncbi:TPA: hypothetical protein ACGVAS_004433 [Vibrio vulnificus]
MSNKQLEIERFLLGHISKTLLELYGEYELDKAQEDKPDAAILTLNDNRRIGIEITSVDRQEDLAYFNEDKMAKPIVKEQIERYQEHGTYSNTTLKKKVIKLGRDYISRGVEPKRSKFSSYKENGHFDELIILAFSDFLDVNEPEFIPFHKTWTNYLLTNSDFPFSKVIFLSTYSRKSALVYDVNNPAASKPNIPEDIEHTLEKVIGGFTPFGKPLDYENFFDQEEEIKPKSKSRASRKKHS